MAAKFEITISGPQGSGKTKFVHGHLIAALRDAGLGAKFFDEDMVNPSMILSGEPHVNVLIDNGH